MNIEIRDSEALRTIRPVDAALYLQSRGWKQASSTPGVSSLWLIGSGADEFEVLLPMREDFRDYALRMGEMLHVLASAEKRSQSQIYRDLLTVTADVIRIRIADPELTDGTLPIEEHAQIAQRARDLVLAAACAATEARSVWHKRKPAQAMEHVRRVRIGQSERGSYVITVISRITPLLQAKQPSLFEADDPYERKVTQTLATSLKALDRATEQAALTREITAFENAVPEGVNANLCDAVVGLWGGDERQRSLEFTFSWSPTRPVPPESVQRVAFGSDRLPVIREAGRVMREREPFPEFELHGPVVKLERQDGSATGKVTVVGIVDDRPVRITVELDDTAYHRALQAHAQGQTVKAVGTLVKEGRGFVLKNPSHLTVEPE